MSLPPLSRGGVASAPYPQPLQICVGPAAEPILKQLLNEGALPGARLLTFVDGRPPPWEARPSW